MKLFTDKELIEIGRKSQELRSKGGQTILNKFGKEHFSKLGKLSAAKRKENKKQG